MLQTRAVGSNQVGHNLRCACASLSHLLHFLLGDFGGVNDTRFADGFGKLLSPPTITRADVNDDIAHL